MIKTALLKMDETRRSIARCFEGRIVKTGLFLDCSLNPNMVIGFEEWG